MGFFKDFKNDMKQAVNELMPGNDEMVNEYDDEDMVNTLDETVPADETYVDTMSQEQIPAGSETAEADSSSDDIDLEDLEDIEIDEADLAEAETDTYTDDMSALVDLLSGKPTTETATAEEANTTTAIEAAATDTPVQAKEEPVDSQAPADDEPETAPEQIPEAVSPEEPEAPAKEEQPQTTVDQKEKEAEQKQEDTMDEDKVIEITTVKEIAETEVSPETGSTTATAPEEISDSTTYITKGTRIEGNLFTDGSVDIIGNIEGDVNCYGKLVVSGSINGKVNASEVYANAARITGEITSTGSVKIGVGSVIVGNVDAQSAVVAGAVNGDLDIKGPVIVDSTAVIMGNIKSRSVQINNGAVIEGFCSQCYSDIDVKSFFA